MRTAGFFAGAFCAITSISAHAQPAFRCAGYEPMQLHSEAAAKPLVQEGHPLRARGKVRVLVVFAQFEDEAPAPVPASATALFDPDHPGSFTHFYHTMSFGQLQVQGTVLTRRYVSSEPRAAYLARNRKEYGQYSRFALEILRQVDTEIDLGQFDDDGPDGVSDSGDDDGVVDYVFINLLSTPQNFLLGGATGKAGLGFESEYNSADRTLLGDPIRLSGTIAHGAILQEGTFAQTVGSMAHEIGHALGLPDLYDTSYQEPAEDSAGVGKWCLMGWGAQGWHGDDGPTPLCAWSRMRLGWIGLNNDRLVEVESDTSGLEIADLHQGGAIYKIPLRVEISKKGECWQEYLLLEQRVRDSNYYNRNLPAEGLLIWRIRPSPLGFNNQEEGKYVDLVCADGVYADAGFPLGRIADLYQGRDNLDFWAHDETYAKAHAGNIGDATDPFDGVRYTRFDLHSNPSTNGEGLTEACTGVVIGIHRQGDAMVAEVSLPRWAGTIREEVHWAGAILVDGDLTIAPEGKLIIHSNTWVRFAGTDRLGRGVDPGRCEVRVQGELKIPMDLLRQYNEESEELEGLKPGQVVFEALVPGETWYGIEDEANKVQMPKKVEIRDAEHGFSVVVDDPATTIAGGLSSQPAAFQLLPNFPNPFNPQTAIRYALPEASQVQVQVYNALGQEVRMLVDGPQAAGMQEVVWDGRDEKEQAVAGGVYLCRLEVEGRYVAGRQMALVR